MQGDAFNCYADELNFSYDLNFNVASAYPIVRSTSGIKRKPDSPTLDEPPGSSNGKKRFIWPQVLHHQFVAAVFDIGLQAASAKEIAALVKEVTSSSSGTSLEMYEANLQKLRLFRDPSRVGHKAFYEGPSVGYNRHHYTQPHALATTDELGQALLRRVQEQLLCISRGLQRQQAFAEYLQSSIQRQSALHHQISSQLDQIHPEKGRSGSFSAPFSQHCTASSNLSSSSRTELSMISEMREQMTLHRKLLLKKEAVQEQRPAALPLHHHASGAEDGQPVPGQQHAEAGVTAAAPVAAPSHGSSAGNGMAGVEACPAMDGAGMAMAAGLPAGVSLPEHEDSATRAEMAPQSQPGAALDTMWDEDTLFFFLDNEFTSSPSNDPWRIA
jgi:hypothetical protein